MTTNRDMIFTSNIMDTFQADKAPKLAHLLARNGVQIVQPVVEVLRKTFKPREDVIHAKRAEVELTDEQKAADLERSVLEQEELDKEATMPDGSEIKWISKPLNEVIKGWDQETCEVDPGIVLHLVKVGILTSTAPGGR